MAKLIFILEDDEEIRNLYRYILEEQDYELATFPSIEAFRQEMAHIPDLYLLDINLPDGNGLTLCQELKQDPGTASIPVIILSAHGESADVNSICPDADFMAKPFDIHQLASKIASKTTR